MDKNDIFSLELFGKRCSFGSKATKMDVFFDQVSSLFNIYYNFTLGYIFLFCLINCIAEFNRTF